MSEEFAIREFGDAGLPTLVYLPGLHGDWTLGTGFRESLHGRLRFIEISYPRSLTWTMGEYVEGLERLLSENKITHGWVLAESFGSQFGWALLDRKDGFKAEGLILAGGFVKHPWKGGPALLKRLGEGTSEKAYARELKLLMWYSRIRHSRTPANRQSLKEFVARRTDLDRRAMRHRLDLLDTFDPRPIARNAQVPVYYLAGAIDPLIPWAAVRRWLRRNCPGYRGGKTIWMADHNVLATAHRKCADLVVKWMSSG